MVASLFGADKPSAVLGENRLNVQNSRNNKPVEAPGKAPLKAKGADPNSRDSTAKDRSNFDVIGPPQHLSIDTEKRQKRRRDNALPSSRSRAASPDRSRGRDKKSRDDKSWHAADNNPGSRKHGSNGAATTGASAKRAFVPGRPNLERSAGGKAPNGNPQCWYAPHESESDPHRLAQRTKQVEYGKNSDGYKEYLKQVPKHMRKHDDPHTPDVRVKCSKRCFDGLMRSWRRRLHAWDPSDNGQALKGAEDKMDADPITTNGLFGASSEPVACPVNVAKQEELQPAPWGEIEKMDEDLAVMPRSMSPAQSWFEDNDSDISDPDSDRVTIYTNEPSPSPSPRPLRADGQHGPNPDNLPNSPFSPWMPLDLSKPSFADALRSPNVTDGVARLSTRILNASVDAEQNNVDAPLDFGEAFATGRLVSTETNNASGSLFGKGMRARSPEPAEFMQDFNTCQELEPDGHSISMRAIADAPMATNSGATPAEDAAIDPADLLSKFMAAQ